MLLIKCWVFFSTKFIAALFPGHFKEKASILHKMAKQKCKVEAAANGE